MKNPTEITLLLNEIGSGHDSAVERLYPLVYDELRRLAQSQLGSERTNHTLQATALVHEAYLRMIDQTRVEYKNRSHFFAIAAQAIRRILVDYARRRVRQKRGGGAVHIPLDEVMNIPAGGPTTDLVGLDDALEQLAAEDPDKARVVEMRFFGGLNNDETAQVLGVSTRTVERHWQYARAWLFRALSNDGNHDS